MTIVEPITHLEAPPEKRLEVQTQSITAEARQVRVADQASLEAAGGVLTNRIKPLLKEADAVFDPVIAAAHTAHKSALAAKAKVVTPLLEAEKWLKVAVSGYLTEQERIRQTEERRLREEEDRRRREAEAEQRRLQEEADRLHAEQIEAEIVEAEARGAAPEFIEQLAATPAPAVAPAEPVFMPAPIAPARVTPVAGVSMRDNWSAEVTSIRQLAAAVGSGSQPEELLIGLDRDKAGKVSSPALNKLASALKSALSISGVRPVNNPVVNARGR